MTTLTETAYWARNTIKYGTFLVIFLIVARLLWIAGTNFYNNIFPPPPPPPTVAFGKLPALLFPERPPGTLTYNIQTPTGELPTLSSQASVYIMPPSSSSLLALDEAKKTASSLGFNGNSTSLSETIYRFEKERSLQILDINIVNKTFALNFDLAQAPELLNMRPRSTPEVLNAIKFFLSPAQLFPTDLSEGSTTFEFLKVEGGQLVGTPSLSEANFVKVNFFRKNYNELPVLTPDKKGNIWFIVSGDTSRDRQIIWGEYHYFTVDEKRQSTYPIKTALQAVNELQTSQAFVAQPPLDGTSNATVRRIYLAYYDSGRPQNFFQPIFVFEGDQGFLAYLPAVAAEYYSSVQPTPEPTAAPE